MTLISAFGSIVEASRAYVQNRSGAVLSSNTLNRAVSNTDEAGFERGFGINSDVCYYAGYNWCDYFTWCDIYV